MKARIVAKLAGILVFSANTNDRYGGTTIICGRSRRSTSSRSSSGPRCRKKRRMAPWVRALLQDYHTPYQPLRAIQAIHIREPRLSAHRTHLGTISVISQFTTSSTCTTMSSPLLTTPIPTIKDSSHRHMRSTSRPRAKCTSMTFPRAKTLRRRASAPITHRQSPPV